MNSFKQFLTIALLLLISCKTPSKQSTNNNPPVLTEKSKAILELGGQTFRDLNHNGQLDIYKDPTRPIQARIENLLSQLTLEEKAGMMFINGAPVSGDGLPEGRKGLAGPAVHMPTVVENMTDRKMCHFNIWEIPDDPLIFAQWYNRVQQLAEGTRLGIPITIASDPRHHFSNSIFSMAAKGFSQFCETLGFAAIGDAQLMKTFADIVRQEYLAIGIREALYPQIDLATEPRWARIEIANLAKALIADYGASDKSVCEVLFGNSHPEGNLPFELPSSMEAVRNQKTDVPYDSENPLYKFGYGLRYER